MKFDIPFVIVEAAPRKRGKTFFNIAVLPRVEKDFESIHIFCPSLAYKDQYYEDFVDNTKYHFHYKDMVTSLDKIIDDQKAICSRAAMDRRSKMRKKKESKKESKRRQKEQTVEFKPFRINGRKRRKKEGQFTIVKGNEFQIPYEGRQKDYLFLLPDIFAGTPGKLQEQQNTKETKEQIEGPQILVVLDDCIGEGLFDFQGAAQELAARGRHFNCSLICSTQHLAKVDIVIRNNADYWFFWSPHSVQELESFIEKFVSKNHLKIVRQVLSRAFKKEHDFIFFDPRALEWEGRFVIGDADAFFASTMLPVFTGAMFEELTTINFR